MVPISFVTLRARRSTLALACAFAPFLDCRAFARTDVALPVHFDLKPAVAGYASNSVGVDSGATFTGATPYGFEPAAIDSRYGGHPCDDVVDRDDDEKNLLRGCVRVANGTRFDVRLPPFTKARIRVVLASTPFWYAPNTTHYVVEASRIDDLSVSVTKGAAPTSIVAADIDLRTAWQKGSLGTQIGSYRKVWFTGAAGADGVLRIGFFGPAGVSVPIAAIDIHPFANAPLVYRRQGAQWLASPSGAIIPGLASFHAHDYAAARAAFASITDPLTRAYAFAFLAGWPDGSAEDPDVLASDLSECTSALDDPSLVENARASELRDRLEDFENAEKHFRLRAFSHAYPLPPAGEGWFNTDDPNVVLAASSAAKSAEKHYYLAENLYAQAAGHTLAGLTAWNAGTHTDSEFEASPFSLRSLTRIARIHSGLNATHGYIAGGTPQADKLAALDLAESIDRGFESYGFLANELHGDAALASLAYAARPEVHHHSENGGLFEHWDGTDIAAASFEPDSAWWQDGILAPDPVPGVPPWADAERRYLAAFRRGVSWWIDDAMSNSEFGGGYGDDPELLGLLALPLAAIEHPSDAAKRDALSTVASNVLNSPWVDDGYYSGIPIDVEHSAEFTTYSLVTGLLLRPGDPDLLARCLDASRHLTSPQAGATAWTTVDPAGDRRFVSYYFNSAGPADLANPAFAPHGVDVPLNAKAIIPALLFLGEFDNPTLENDLLEWLRGWRKDALTPFAGLPLGLVPACVRASDHAFGNAGQWWVTPGTLNGSGSYAFPGNIPAIVQLYSGFFEAAHQLDDATPHVWLLPALRSIQGVLALEAKIDAGTPPSDLATVGTSNWAVNQLRTSPDFWRLTANARPMLAIEPTLRTVDDPDVPGTAPYVSDAVLAAIDAALAEHDAGYPTHLALPQGPIDLVNSLYGRKGKTVLISQLQRGAKWLANYFPLATTSVLYTDRAFLFNQASHQTLYGMLTGGALGQSVPNHICTWTTPGANDPPLDVAVLVNDLASGSAGIAPRLRVLLYNFESSPRQVGMRLWNRLPLGQYALRRGKALASTDWFENGAYASSTIVFDERGDRFDFELPGRTLTLIEVERTGDAPSQPEFDLALAASGTPFESTLEPDELKFNAIAYDFGDQSVAADGIVARVTMKKPSGAPLALDKKGTLELVLPLDADFTGVPGFDGYDLPATSFARTLPLSPVLIELIALGSTIHVRFESRVADTDATNDSIAYVFDKAALQALHPSLVLKEPKGSPAKINKAAAKRSKPLGKSWKNLFAESLDPDA